MFSRVDSFALETTAACKCIQYRWILRWHVCTGINNQVVSIWQLVCNFASRENSPAGPVPTAPKYQRANLESSMLSVSLKRLSTNDQLREFGKAYSSALKLYKGWGDNA